MQQLDSLRPLGLITKNALRFLLLSVDMIQHSFSEH